MNVVTDYDWTLVLHNRITINGLYGEFTAGYEWKDNEKLIKELLEYQNKGHSLYICTKRNNKEENLLDKFDRAVPTHVEYLEDKYGLKFKDVIYTAREDKNSFLKKLNTNVFFDDDSYNICEAARVLNLDRLCLVKNKEEIVKNCTLDMYVEMGRAEIFEYE